MFIGAAFPQRISLFQVAYKTLSSIVPQRTEFSNKKFAFFPIVIFYRELDLTGYV
jgi:hypothetical protein